MTDLNPEIWNNDTLGAAANNERLDRLEKQNIEDRAARLEDREPREVVVENDYPGWTPAVSDRTGTVPSSVAVVHFADEDSNDVVQTGPAMKPEGMSDEEWEAQAEAPSNPNGNYDPADDPEDVETGPLDNDNSEESQPGLFESSESTESDSTEESDSTKWT